MFRKSNCFLRFIKKGEKWKLFCAIWDEKRKKSACGFDKAGAPYGFGYS